MPTNAENAYESMLATKGRDEGIGEWFDVTQELVNSFADTTHDHQFIHVDPERAKGTPFGGTIAHGFLTLSMMTHLIGSLPRDENPPKMEGIMMGVNYGFDKVRFVSPVKVGSKIRAGSVVANVELKGNAVQVTRTVTISTDNDTKPAVVADWITRLFFS